MLSANDSRGLTLLFHLNSEPWLNQEAYSAAAHVPHFMPSPIGQSQVLLPLSEPSPLMQVLQRRHSCRRFQETELELVALADLLRGAYGVFDGEAPAGGCPRPAPSAGALFPFHVLVATRRVRQLPDGMYAYNGLHHRLECLRLGRALDDVTEFILTGSFLENANLAIVLAGVLDRTCMKYGPRGYRYMLLEAGHVAQNICLLASERGLGSLCVGGFYDTRLNRLLGYDGVATAAMYCVAVGTPEEES